MVSFAVITVLFSFALMLSPSNWVLPAAVVVFVVNVTAICA
jgi:hypothetical protein